MLQPVCHSESTLQHTYYSMVYYSTLTAVWYVTVHILMLLIEAPWSTWIAVDISTLVSKSCGLIVEYLINLRNRRLVVVRKHCVIPIVTSFTILTLTHSTRVVYTNRSQQTVALFCDINTINDICNFLLLNA